MRTCAKMRCDSPAVATVELRYEVREVLVDDLSSEPDPNRPDLCAEHVRGLTPPIGWQVKDERTPIPAPSF
ncbi:MAG: DUF3499 family protein [Actinomycetota bacterium]